MYIYQGEEIKEIDQEAAEKGLDTFSLMENAGRALFEAISKHINKTENVLILAGKGNNGGDGIVLARYLKQAGYRCDLTFPIGEPASETARQHYRYFLERGFESSKREDGYDVIIDALLGVGTKGPIREHLLKLVEWANQQPARRIAIDIPTGVRADSGEIDCAFQADWTYSLHGYKPSAFLEESTDYYGQKQVLDIGLPQTSAWKVWGKEDVASSFPKRNEAAHKGTFGSGLLIAGTDAMPGSAMLASLAAMRSGIGKLTVATSRFAASIIAGRVPECTYLLDGLDKIADGVLPKGMKAAAIGPGLDEPEKIDRALDVLFQSGLPLVIDAGALKASSLPKQKGFTVLTPHPGEFSRMTGLSVQEIQKNRLKLAADYAIEQGAAVVLKGRNTVIAFPDGEVRVNQTGNAGLAKGGTGDTLTGMLLAFLSYYEDKKAAVSNAVFLHGKSAEYWSETRAQASLLATDVSENLAYVMKEFE